MKESPSKYCPVPKEQQPINEYQQLKDSWFFQWATREKWAYAKKLIWVWLLSWVITGPIAAYSFPPEKHLIKFGLCGTLGGIIFVALVLLRLYLGWYYVLDRLKAETICYEESGWYDGQSWQKPASVLTRDRLIASYQVLPILTRLKKTALILLVIVSNGVLLWLWQK